MTSTLFQSQFVLSIITAAGEILCFATSNTEDCELYYNGVRAINGLTIGRLCTTVLSFQEHSAPTSQKIIDKPQINDSIELQASSKGKQFSTVTLTSINNKTDLTNSTAEIVLFSTNLNVPKTIFKGVVTSCQASSNGVALKMLPISIKLLSTFQSLYSEMCRAEFCDDKCTLNATSYSCEGKVLAECNGRNLSCSFPLQKNFINGIVSFTSGVNSGFATRIITQAVESFGLLDPLPNPAKTDDTISILVGCDKTLSSCRDVFNNVINFRGEPFINGATLADLMTSSTSNTGKGNGSGSKK